MRLVTQGRGCSARSPQRNALNIQREMRGTAGLVGADKAFAGYGHVAHDGARIDPHQRRCLSSAVGLGYDEWVNVQYSSFVAHGTDIDL